MKLHSRLCRLLRSGRLLKAGSGRLLIMDHSLITSHVTGHPRFSVRRLIALDVVRITLVNYLNHKISFK